MPGDVACPPPQLIVAPLGTPVDRPKCPTTPLKAWPSTALTGTPEVPRLDAADAASPAPRDVMAATTKAARIDRGTTRRYPTVCRPATGRGRGSYRPAPPADPVERPVHARAAQSMVEVGR